MYNTNHGESHPGSPSLPAQHEAREKEMGGFPLCLLAREKPWTKHFLQNLLLPLSCPPFSSTVGESALVLAGLNGLCDDPEVIMWVATTTNALKPSGWGVGGRKSTVRAIDFRDRFTAQKTSALRINLMFDALR